MEFSKELEQFLNHDEGAIKLRASRLRILADDFKNGNISDDEYNELVDDVMNLETIEQNIGDLERREMIIDACKKMISIAKLVSKAV